MKQIIILMTIIAALLISIVTIARYSSRPTISRSQKVRLGPQTNENASAKVRRANAGREDALLSLLWASAALAAAWLGGRTESGRLALAPSSPGYRKLPRPDLRFDSPIFGERPAK